MISSPNFPNPYEGTFKCMWRIKVRENTKLFFKFHDFEVCTLLNIIVLWQIIYENYIIKLNPNSNDHLRIVDEHKINPNLAIFDSDWTPQINQSFKSVGNEIVVHFESDGQNHEKIGFKLQFSIGKYY